MKTILESNQLISEFMGAVKSDYGNYMIFTVENPKDCGKINHSEILYNKEWNWLMPVIEKIANYKYEDRDTAYPRTFGMIGEQGISMFRFNRHQLFQEKTLLESAYMACIDFIEWHNEKKNEVLKTQAGGV